MQNQPVRIELISPEDVVGIENDLAEITLDCIADGASIGFLSDFTMQDARAWWAGSLRADGTLTWVARDDAGRARACIQLKLAQMPNQAHRADVLKLLVHRSARGRGISSRLMTALEAEASTRGRWLLVLDTETGSAAETIYAHWGWQRVGVIDDYAGLPDGTLVPTTIFAKRLK